MLDPITQDACAFYEDHARFADFTGVVYEASEGERIAQALGNKKAAMLRNHGLLTVGETVDEAAWWFITMDRSCQAQLLAESAGERVKIDSAHAAATRDQVGSHLAGWFQCQPLLARITREEPDLLEQAMPAHAIDSIAALKDLVGREIAVTDWLTVTQDRIRQFAEATEDRQWIHVDPERARSESPYGTTIVHGFLTLSLMSCFLKQALDFHGLGMSVNYGLNRVRFPAPVPAGSQIRARVALSSAKDFPGGCEAVFSFTIEREGSAKPCCVAEWVVRFYYA